MEDRIIGDNLPRAQSLVVCLSYLATLYNFIVMEVRRDGQDRNL